MSQPDSRMRVHADLVLSIDGVEASVLGDGGRLTVSTKDAAALITSAARTATAVDAGAPAIRRSIASVGATLNDAGLVVQVVDARGTLLEIGSDCRSIAGQLLLGSRHARLGGSRATLTAAAAYVRAVTAVRTRIAYTVGGFALAGLVVAAAARRR